jgi:hypothetical protein
VSRVNFLHRSQHCSSFAMLAVMRKITPVSMVGSVSAGDDLARSGDAVTVDALDYRHDVCLR